MERDADEILAEEGPDEMIAAHVLEPYIPQAKRRIIRNDDTGQDDPDFQRAAKNGAESWQKPIEAEDGEKEKPVEATPAQIMAAKIKLVAYTMQDPATLPTREFVYGTHLARKYLSAAVATGATGKTSLKLVEALAMITGKALLGVKPAAGPLNVFFWGGEDPLEEVKRKFEAGRFHYGVTPEDITGKLYLHSGRDMEIRTAISVRGGRGFEIARPVVDALISEFQAGKVDAGIIDPFVSSHSVTENDNNAIDAVAKEWGRIADVCNCAIDLIHHLRKVGDGEQTIQDARGASSLIDATRAAELLVKGSKDELGQLGIEPTDYWRYFRVADGKCNLAPPTPKSTWYKLVSIDLGNGKNGARGDNVGVVTRWEKPGMFDEFTLATLDILMRKIRDTDYRTSTQSPGWAGKAVGEVLDIDADSKAGKERIKTMLSAWMKSGALKKEVRQDRTRQDREYVVLGNWQFTTPDPAKKGR